MELEVNHHLEWANKGLILNSSGRRNAEPVMDADSRWNCPVLRGCWGRGLRVCHQGCFCFDKVKYFTVLQTTTCSFQLETVIEPATEFVFRDYLRALICPQISANLSQCTSDITLFLHFPSNIFPRSCTTHWFAIFIHTARKLPAKWSRNLSADRLLCSHTQTLS